MTALEAHPIEGMVWCDACGDIHTADLESVPPTLWLNDYADAECIEPVQVDVPLPKDWERTYLAGYTDRRDQKGGGGYDLWLARPPLLDCHHPMYYVERSSL